MTKGLAGAVLRPPKALETAVGTVTVSRQHRRNTPQYSTYPPSNSTTIKRRKDQDDNNDTYGTNFKPVNLAYRALECRGEERDKQTKSPLIIHHSLYGRKENWNPISELINRITMRKIINVDARNHGESPQTNEMTLPLMSKDIVHLMKHVKNENDKFSFMGHSMGGRIGILLALTHPQLLDKLIVVDSSVVVNENSIRRWNLLRQACSNLIKIEDRLKKFHGYERLGYANKAIENIIVEKTERANFLSNLILSDKSNQRSIWRVNMNAYLANPEMMSQIPPLDGARFEGRTLFINGDRSQFVSRDHTDSIKKVFPNSELVWFKDSGHLVHLDQQKEFCEKVVTFLER